MQRVLVLVLLAGCPETKAPPRQYTVEKPQPTPDAPAKKPRHASHEHPHGGHPHARDAHHHHAHVHPHVDGPDGHHHPY